MATDVAEADDARDFAEELGIVGADFETLLKTPEDQIEKEDDMPVPKTMKKAWHKWCVKGHPDKGGKNEDFMAMKTRYETFKAWFKAQREAPSTRAKMQVQQKAQAQQLGDKALEEGKKALEGHQYEQAQVFAEEAINAYETYKSLQLNKKDAEKMVREAKCLKKTAEEQIRLRELELRQREDEKRLREEFEEMCISLNALFYTVCSAVGVVGDGIAITQKIEILRSNFDVDKDRIMRLERDNADLKKRFRSAHADIERLENENLKFRADAKNDSRNFQECQQKLKDSEQRTRALQVECDNLKKEVSEAIEEASGANGGFNLFGFLNPGSPKDKLKSIIKSQRQQLTGLGSALEASKAECDQLATTCHNLETQITQQQREQEQGKEQHMRLIHNAHELKMAKQEVEKRLEKEIQTHEVTVKSFEDDLVVWRVQAQELKAQLNLEKQQADERIQKMRAENERLQKEVDRKQSELGEMQDEMHQMQNFCDDREQRAAAEVARRKEKEKDLQEPVNGLTEQLQVDTAAPNELQKKYDEVVHKREQQLEKETQTKEEDQRADDGEGCNKRDQRSQEALMQVRQPHGPPASTIVLTINVFAVCDVMESEPKSLKALNVEIEKERDVFRAKAESLQKENDAMRSVVSEMMKIGGTVITSNEHMSATHLSVTV